MDAGAQRPAMSKKVRVTIMKEIKLFHLEGCPYCVQAFKALRELTAEEPAYQSIPIRMFEENKDAEVVARYDFYYEPTMYVGEDKIYEAHPGESYAECREQVKKVLDLALAAE